MLAAEQEACVYRNSLCISECLSIDSSDVLVRAALRQFLGTYFGNNVEIFSVFLLHLANYLQIIVLKEESSF